MRPRRLSLKEAFVPLAHPPGHAQADFGEAWAVLCDGHVAAFDFFGGAPLSILYDNTKLAVAKILGDGTRVRSTLFAGLQSHYLFQDRFGRPGKGADKGDVEGMVGFGRRTFMVPIPEAPDIDALNAMLLERRKARQAAVLRGADGTIGERLAAAIVRRSRSCRRRRSTPATSAPRAKARSLRLRRRPPLGKVSSQALGRCKGADHSVPVACAPPRTPLGDVLVKGYVDAVAISVGAEEIARHPPSVDSPDFVFDPARTTSRCSSRRSAP